MARIWLDDVNELDALYPPDKPFPESVIEALAQEFEAVISDRGAEWVETLIAGRPPTLPLMEWAARELKPEHQDCIPWDDALSVRR